MKLEKDARYQARIELDFVQSFATNAMLENELRKAGFKDVAVSGVSRVRTAVGAWAGETREAALPGQVKEVKKL